MSEQAPAGWYPDGSGNERYWDGSAWTDHLRTPGDVPPPPPAPLLAAEQAPAEEAPEPATGDMFSKFGSAVKKASDDRKSAKDEAKRDHAERQAAAGALVTSGTFGVSSIEIYAGGYVRVAPAAQGRIGPVRLGKDAPFERLRSITFALPEREQAAAGGSAMDGAVAQAVTGLVKGGRTLMKGTIVGIATTGIAHLATNGSRKSTLVIVTDKMIHNLNNQTSNSIMNMSRKEHDAVGAALAVAGNAALGVSQEPMHVTAIEGVVEPTAAQPAAPSVAAAIVTATPTLSDRLRELSALHQDGILSDDEFATAKGKLIAGL